jgi:8-oxo-dGTP pyrophosphatase MutT (NUDIX family)
VVEEIAVDGRQYIVPRTDARISTVVSWHPASACPDGVPFGASGICVAPTGEIALVSVDAKSWFLPGGRPEGRETAAETLRREMREEACVSVQQARLLGYCQIADTGGPGGGVPKVRAWFRAEVRVEEWDPQFEIPHRCLVPPLEVRGRITVEEGEWPLINRALVEARVG